MLKDVEVSWMLDAVESERAKIFHTHETTQVLWVCHRYQTHQARCWYDNHDKAVIPIPLLIFTLRLLTLLLF